MLAGKAGKGCARSIIDEASASRSGCPELCTISWDSTCPVRSTAKPNRTVPSSLRSRDFEGYRLYCSRRRVTAVIQVGATCGAPPLVRAGIGACGGGCSSTLGGGGGGVSIIACGSGG